MKRGPRLLCALALTAWGALGCAQETMDAPDTGTPSGTGGAATGAGGSATGAGGSATGAGGSATGAGGSIVGGDAGTGGARADAGAGTDGGRDAGTGGADGGRDAGAGGARVDAGAGAGGSSGGDAGALPNVTVWIAGDSTVQYYAPGNAEGSNGSDLEGWGQELGTFFTTRVTINNQAIGGRSVAFFMWNVARDTAGNYLCVDTQGNPQYVLDTAGNRTDTTRWAAIKNGIRAGDFLLAQFGTNDETHDCPRFVSLPDFETDLGIMADAVRAKGATPIFVTPMGHRSFTGTMVRNTLLPYANAMKDEATMKSVEIVDLNLRSVEYYMMVGNTFLSTNIFDGGTTHFIQAGAVKMAELIAGELRAHGGPLAAYLR